MNNDERITYFAETDARNKRIKFGIKGKDRTRHVYVIGKTGMGKSTLLENMAVQDIMSGDGMAIIDPHGKTADLIMEYVPKERIRDVIYIAPFDLEHPISFNVLESVTAEKRHLVVSGLMSTFKKIWVDAWSARMEYILTNTLLALLEYPGSTLLGVNKMLSDKAYRNEVISKITDPGVKSFWTKEFANYSERMAQDAVPAIQNKVGQFTANPLIRNMIGQPQSSFDFREAMDRRKIVIINLSKGKIGDENMKLLGGLLVTKIYLAAMSRADVPDRVMKMLPHFYLYVDEFQNFANASFADILSESRKYKLNLTIAHQYIEQMDEIVRPAVFGNVGTMMVFRVGANDAEALEKEFAPQFTVEDLVNLGFAQIYLKLMIDGLTSAPFSARTLPPIAHPEQSYVKEIIDASREQFARPRAQVEAEIARFHEPAPRPTPPRADQPIKATFSPGNEPRPAPAPAPASAPASAPVPKAVASQPQAAAPKTISQPAPASAPAPAAVPKAQVPNRPTPPPLEGGSTSLKDALAKVKPPTPPAPAVSATPPAPQPPKPKPVSLSALAPKQQDPRRPDPKAQDPKNVDALKSALSAVLKKPEQKPPESAAMPARAPAPAAQEVPEDVLKSVLKLD
jgi:hypothetical protein